MVVDDVGQMVGGEVVGALVEHFVVEHGGVDGHLAAEQVVDGDVATRLYLEAHHVGGARCYQPLHLVGLHGQRVAHASAGRGVILEVGRGLPGRFEFGGSVEGYIGFAGVEQTARVLAVDVAALALLVGAVGSALSYALVDLYSEPCQGLVDVVLGTGHETLRIGVLDAEYHVAPCLAGEKVVIESRAHASDVEGACRRGSETHPDFTLLCHLDQCLLGN